MRLCSVDGCDRKHRCKGLCGLHYSRLMNVGPRPVRQLPTIERVKELVRYDPQNGSFTWIAGQNIGKRATSLPNSHGYLRVVIDGKSIGAQRFAWFYMTGEWPEVDTDHRDGRRADNRFDNLRKATRSGNMQNLQKAHRDSATGFLGVSRHRDRFAASISVDGNRYYLGSYKTPEAAHEAYLVAKRKLHPAGNI
jgi:hypothetical protein